MYALYHDDGCGKVAFLIRRKPQPGEPLTTKECTKPDGAPIKSGDPIQCYSCGERLELPVKTKNVRLWLGE